MPLLNGWSVNTPDFWRKWAAAGGNVETYITSALPTYGVIGALALTHQMGMSTAPPPEYTTDSAWLALYAGLIHMATLLSFALILLPIVLHTQYNCCITSCTRVEFVCKFGSFIPLLFSMLIVMGACWFAALLIALSPKYSGRVFVMLVIETGLVGGVAYMALPIWIQCWNANYNYGPVLDPSSSTNDSETNSACCCTRA
jgi:hypothetical protein